MLRIIILFLTLFFISGCNFGPSQEELAAEAAAKKAAFEKKIAESKEIQLKKIEAQKEAELAKIAAQTQLASLEKEQLLQKIKLQTAAQKEQLLLEQAGQKAAFEAKMRELEVHNAMERERYIMLIAFVMLLVISFFLYLYFKKRHENKLRSYEDNLQKYFHQQENMTKMRIAEKIIDTVASGKLDKAQESELIRALGGTLHEPTPNQQLLEKIDDAQDAEIIEEDEEERKES